MPRPTTERRDLLVEIGTEELPPKALKALAEAFGSGMAAALEKTRLAPGSHRVFATPRRLAVLVEALLIAQPGGEEMRRGPALSASFDAQGKPTRAAEGFARSCGVTVDQLERLETEQGSWLAYKAIIRGRSAAELLPSIVEETLAKLPIPKRMRWGAGEAVFVRPIHWAVMLLGDDLVPGNVLGIKISRETRGHRFHHPEQISLANPQEYAHALREKGQVIADCNERREAIRAQVVAAATSLKGTALTSGGLLDEVTALVEWPVAITGSFDADYLRLPRELLVVVLQTQQRYFPIVGTDDGLLNRFVFVANIASKNPETVRAGNERVVRPRLSDAAYFWDKDRKTPLAERIEGLKRIVFQEKLGSLHDKSARVAALAAEIAPLIGGTADLARRAAMLAKCDLLTELVGEFPELQGTMGRYYALHDGESVEVAEALDEQYRPRFAGDSLPATRTGQALAIAEKLDTLVGIFGIGQAPTGDKDPFALRRTGLGILRVLIEGELDLDLFALTQQAAASFPGLFAPEPVANTVFDFMLERLRAYYQDAGFNHDQFDSVLARKPLNPLDFHLRMRAVQEFQALPEAASLAAANKRIRNILRQAGDPEARPVSPNLFNMSAESDLAASLKATESAVRPLIQRRDYTAALRCLAGLRVPVDGFFDKVMVLDEDLNVRANRLALLNRLFGLFFEIADISRLQT